MTLIGCILAKSPSGSNAFGPVIDVGHNLCSDASGNFSGPGSLSSVDPQLGPLDNYGGPTPTLPLLAGSPAIDAGDSASCPATDQRGRPRPYGPACDIGAFESSPPYLVRGGLSGFTLVEEIDITAGVGAANAMSINRRYSLEGLPPSTYQVTPVNSSYLFVPPSRMITVGPDQLNMDFRAYRWNALSIDGFSSGVLHLVYAGTNGQTIRLLASTDLINWSAIATNTIGTSNLVDLFVPEVASFPARFYATMRP